MLQAQGITKRFGATLALREVSLSLAPGRVHCLVGENGAGKSTLGKVIGGLIAPDEGELLLDGRLVRFGSVKDARAAGIAMAHQELSLAPDLSVIENICLGTERPPHPFARLRRAKERERCQGVLAQLGLHTSLSEPVRRLSPANQQLVEVAKALYLGPRLLILDEPTAMLGAGDKGRLFDLLRRLAARGTALVFVTHHMEEVVEVGDSVSIMKDGTILTSVKVTPQTIADDLVQLLTGRAPVAPARTHSRADKEPVLRIGGLRTRNGSDGEIVVGRGEIVGLYGVVGCGREELAKAIVGLTQTNTMPLTLLGSKFRPRNPAEAARRAVAYLPTGRAANGLLPTRSIRDNLMLTQLRICQRAGILRPTAEKQAAQAQLAALKAKYAHADAAVTSLSGGNQQKVLIGRALGRPLCLAVLEDPTAGIDIAAKEEIHALLRRRAELGLSIVLVSSDLMETLRLCDRIYTMFKGALAGHYEHAGQDHHASILADVLGGGSAGQSADRPSPGAPQGPGQEAWL